MNTSDKGQPRDLKERTLSYADSIIHAFTSLSPDEVARVLGRQMLRSGTSVGAHYRESSRAKSDADIISKMESALQELDETDYWLTLLKRNRLLPPDAVNPLIQETNELISILVSIVTKIKNRP